MPPTVKWLPRPEKHDYRAAEDYLSLLMPPKRAASLSRRLAAAKDDITHRKAKDILRASQLPLLGEENKHVASDLRKLRPGAAQAGRQPQPQAGRREGRHHPPQGQGHPARQPAAPARRGEQARRVRPAQAASGVALSPILLLRGDETHPLVVADGYHRVCASYWIDENTDIPCILVDA